MRVTQCERVCIGRRKISQSTVFAGEIVGVCESADDVWLVSCMDYDLGLFDEQDNRVAAADNQFQTNMLPVSTV